MKNTIIDGVEYATNLNGEQYEVMIPGTRCPVSVGVLESWYWNEGMAVREISSRLGEQFEVGASDTTIYKWLKNSSIRIRNHQHRHKKYSIRINKEYAYKPDTQGAGTLFICSACGKEKTRNHRGQKYCGAICSNTCKNKNIRKSSGVYISGLICPNCKYQKVYQSGWNRLYLPLRCGECLRGVYRPIIEFGLRRDLEAAGALDDGRILASAFATEKEKTTAS